MEKMFPSLLISLIFTVPFLVAPPPAEAQRNASPLSSADSSEEPSHLYAAAQNNSRRARARRRTPVRRSRGRVPAGSQMRPSRERVVQIQKALTEAGYDPGPADGFWGPNSISAFQDFQEDRGRDPTGWIDALSLIDLGLGPKYDTPAKTQNSAADSSR